LIIVCGGIKGGGGKTTISTNLCVLNSQNRKTLLVDGDDQRSASDWANQREAMKIPTPWATVRLSGKALHTEVKKIMSGFDDIIIDVGGFDSTSQRSAMSIADIYLVPFKPKSFDMWTLGAVRTMINEISVVNPKLRPIAVINHGDPRGDDNNIAIEMIKEFDDIECAPSVICYRKSFANAAADGLGVVELKKQDHKANQEIAHVYSYVFCT
jgi:chromosome partitioning protein